MASKKDPRGIAEGFSSELRGIYGEDLQSVLLVGSAARSDFRPGKSDVNTLVTLTSEGMDWLEKVYKPLQSWRRKGLAVPHFMLPNAVEFALDSYPLEFLDFKTFHEVILGPDILADITIPHEPLRLQIERELRGKIFLLRQIFASQAGHSKQLKGILVKSVSLFTAVFQGILELGQLPIPKERSQLFRYTAEFAGFKDGVFQQILGVKGGEKDKNLRVIFKDLISEVEVLISWIDKFQITE